MWKSHWAKWGIVLGFALGGFFDGILLHQILQWHHLLSLVPGIDDLRLQVLWDGYFHALMYLIAIVGLWGLWRANRNTGGASGSALLGALLLGFGIWHGVDTILSHWILGIHRVKLDSDTPLLWDLFWFVAFGVVPIFGGRWIVRASAARLRNSVAPMLLLTAGTAGAGAWALQPPPERAFTTVVFGLGAGPKQVFVALEATGANLVWTDRSMGVVVVAVPREQKWRFYLHGALLVGGTGVGAGCFNWSGASGKTRPDRTPGEERQI